METTKQKARRAGLLYLLMGITAPIGLMVVPGRLIVSGNAAATAERIRDAEWLLRVGIASELFHQAVAIFLVMALFRLFKDVDERLSAMTVILGALVSVPIMFLNVLNQVAALILVSGAPFLAPFDGRQLDALAYLFIRLHSRGIDIASIFWGLWLFPFGALVIRSGFIPRALGVLMMIAGAGYLAASFTSLVLPNYEKLVGGYALILEMGELPIIFWLLIWGARERPARTPARAAEASAFGRP